MQNSPKSDKKEVDIIEIVSDLWKRRKLIIWFIGVTVFLGLVIAFTTPNEYTSEVRLLPELNEQGGMSALQRQFGGLGSMMGINLGAIGSEALNPNLYPDIVMSTPFLLRLMDEELFVPKLGHKVTLYEYLYEHKPFSLPGFLKKYTMGLPGQIILSIRKKRAGDLSSEKKTEYISMTLEQFEVMEELKKRIKSSIDKRNGTFVASVQMHDPLYSAIIAERITEFLTEYVTAYRIEKAVFDFEFIKERQKESEVSFIAAQNTLSTFRDENRNIISARVLSEEERLQSEYNLAFNVYNNLNLELEQARINVQKETPVFKLLSPAEIAVKKTKPKKLIILIVSGIMGFLFAFSYIFLESFYSVFKAKLRENHPA